MHDEYDIVETSFRKQSFPEYFQTLDDFSDALDANELYNTGKPAHVPSGETFRSHKAAMKELGGGADRGDSLLIERRQAVRDVSDLDIYAAVSYLKTIAIAKRDPSILHTTTLPVKENRQKTPRKIALPQAVEIWVELQRLKGTTGAIAVKGHHVRNGGPYLLHLCKGEPVSEESWYNPGGRHNSCRNIVIKGLEPGGKYYVRIRVDRPDGAGAWSRPVSIIVL